MNIDNVEGNPDQNSIDKDNSVCHITGSKASTDKASSSGTMKTPPASHSTATNNSALDGSQSSDTDGRPSMIELPSSETFLISLKDSVLSTSTEFFSQQRISPENFTAFCDQLHSFVQCIKNVQEITNLTYNLPSRAQEILDEEAKELDCLYGEVRDAANNIERIKAQRKAIRKEKFSAEKLLKKMKDEETREMETVISVYDRGMFARWEVIKNSRKLEAVENFLYDIEGKLLAMKHLKILATQKVNKLLTWTLKENTEKRNRKETKKTSDKEGGTRKDSNSATEQETKRRKTRQPRLSKTELPRIDTPTTTSILSTPSTRTTTRSQIGLASLYTLDDNLGDRSHDSIRTVELNSEMQTVLRTLFGGPARREGPTGPVHGPLNAPTISTTGQVSSLPQANDDNREIHIYLA